MSSHRRKLLPLYIASLLSGQAAAVGLGEIEWRSPLGAPLEALVPLNQLGDLGVDQLKVRIASEADYQAMGVEYTYQHTLLKIEPVVQNGRGYVRITTRDPVAEPYLNFVLDLQWPQGKVAREYTVLLDLPTTAIAANSAAPVAAPPPVSEVRPAAPVRSEPRRTAVTQRQLAEIPEGTYITQRGDSLWRVAARLRPEGVSQAQMMNAVLAANPQAFIDGNPDRLKEAVPVAMPDAQQIAAADSAEPASTRAFVTPTVATAAPAPAAAAPAPVDNSTTERLSAENAALKSEVAELNGSVTALNQSLAASEQRLRQMENQLADLVHKLQQSTPAAAPMAAAQIAQNPGVGTESMINQVIASDLAPAPRAQTPWWVHMLYWLGIAGVGAWAVREHFWPRRLVPAGVDLSNANANVVRAPAPTPLPAPSASPWSEPAPWSRRRDPEELVETVSEQPAPVERVHEPVMPTSFDAGQEAVDASISAGVFLAFGRYDEAEKLLLEALDQNSDRADLKLQLLDVYLQQGNGVAFERLAAAIEKEHDDPEVIAELAVLRESFHTRH